MKFSDRQTEIIEIVKENGPITGDEIAEKLGLSRATIRSDLSVLTMIDILGARPKFGYFYIGKSIISHLSEDLKKLNLKDYMSLPFSCDQKTSVYDVIVDLFMEDLSSMFITDNGFLTGIVSRKDLIRFMIGDADIKKTPISVIMTRMPNIFYVSVDESVYKAAQLIVTKGIDSLPVVKIKNKKDLEVVGRFTKTNVTRLFVDVCDGEIF
ncbi:helix-turn-helix transcriptional regulator [Peptoniphilus rhinitidis]|uniref:helix-turn-helix transcriptional regulator n=1 Tax=Peptoniphilus rhinitidis TaxID=1175452 RepID=UPI0029002845|nr:helix-turn-helix transcriptional regulator [Peptoniphilus rhinitidis]MDU1043272.1 helix-turn-helix transcriptional regulator [Peptoniphilus rhinitidis]MDU2109687.1 helix-turn-helix transcriptional regulator [Peptoniphilus lacydonensis]MDU3750797.1 helix-turn-helix transcriptional regulator [Peptoniphilus rhinitidis]